MDKTLYEQNKSTISYIFLLTALPQFIIIAVFFSVCCWAFWTYRYGNIIMTLAGIAGFIAMLFCFVCVSVFVSSYGQSPLVIRSKFGGDKETPTITEIRYSPGRKNIFTGRSSIDVTTRQIHYAVGGPIIGMTLNCILLGFTGIFQFALETFRVCYSEERKQSWEESRAYLKSKIEEEGSTKFWSAPILCAKVMLLIWAIAILCFGFSASSYSPNKLKFNITEKINSEYNNTRIHTLFSGEVQNTGSAKIKHVEGILYFKDKKGNVLYEGKAVISAPLSAIGEDLFLQKNETWEVKLSVDAPPTDTGAQTIWNLGLEDVEIGMTVTEIAYKDNTIDFPNGKKIRIKKIGK